MASANVKTSYGQLSRQGLGELKYAFNCWGVMEIGDAIDGPAQWSRGKQNIEDLYAMAKHLLDDDWGGPSVSEANAEGNMMDLAEDVLDDLHERIEILEGGITLVRELVDKLSPVESEDEGSDDS